MSDPRTTLAHTTLTGVYSQNFKTVGTLYPRTTSTPLDQDRLVRVEGLYQPQSQEPRYEGELVIYFHEEFGVKVAEMYCGIDINGTLEWKPVQFRDSTLNPTTGDTNLI